MDTVAQNRWRAGEVSSTEDKIAWCCHLPGARLCRQHRGAHGEAAFLPVILARFGFFTKNLKFFRTINSHVRDMVNKPLPQKSKDLHFANH